MYLCPPCLEAGAFAGHLVDLLDSDQTSEFRAVFDIVERVLVDGDEGVRYIVTYGLIESLQNLASDRSGWAPAGRFRQWLRPATLRAWDEVHMYRGTSDPGAGWPPSGVIGEHLATVRGCSPPRGARVATH